MTSKDGRLSLSPRLTSPRTVGLRGDASRTLDYRALQDLSAELVALTPLMFGAGLAQHAREPHAPACGGCADNESGSA